MFFRSGFVVVVYVCCSGFVGVKDSLLLFLIIDVCRK